MLKEEVFTEGGLRSLYKQNAEVSRGHSTAGYELPVKGRGLTKREGLNV